MDLNSYLNEPYDSYEFKRANATIDRKFGQPHTGHIGIQGVEQDLKEIYKRYRFYQNNHRVSEPIDLHQNIIEPVENDW